MTFETDLKVKLECELEDVEGGKCLKLEFQGSSVTTEKCTLPGKSEYDIKLEDQELTIGVDEYM